MAEVGRVTPGKPIWPGHHGELPERGSRTEDESKRRKPPVGDTEPESPPEEKEDHSSGHLDEYVQIGVRKRCPESPKSVTTGRTGERQGECGESRCKPAGLPRVPRFGA